MRILSAAVDWHMDFDNEPTLRIEVDALPDHKGLRYERRERYLFAQTEDGYADFLYDDPHNHAGYGGASFTLTLKDGSQVTLVGPWSGNEQGAAALGFPQTYGCTAHVKGKSQYSLTHIHLLEPVWLAAIAQFCPEAEAVAVRAAKCVSPQCDGIQNRVIGYAAGEEVGPVVYAITRRGMTPTQTWAWKRVLKWRRIVAEVRDEPPTWRDDPSPKDKQRKHAAYVNGLIAGHGLEAHGLAPFDLDALPPLLPAREPEPVSSYDPEDWGS